MKENSEIRISFQGIEGAYSHLSILNCYKNRKVEVLACRSFQEALDLVEENKADIAFIPIENSYAGRVAEMHNILPELNLTIVGEYFHKVEHQLLGVKGAKIDDVKEVYSHPQALMQCKNYLNNLGLHSNNFYDTAGAALEISKLKDKTKASISSSLCAKIYGLDILAENIQDDKNNTTLFIQLAKEPIEISPSKDKTTLTSMIFTTRNISGGLYKALGGFATNNINIVKLESYIPNYKDNEARFFITFEGNPEQKNVSDALEEFGFFTKKIKILGVYYADEKRY
jgi:prephenate dehydratase